MNIDDSVTDKILALRQRFAGNDNATDEEMAVNAVKYHAIVQRYQRYILYYYLTQGGNK